VLNDVLATLLLVIICLKIIQLIIIICNVHSVLSTARLQEIYNNFLICSHDKDPSNRLFYWPTRVEVPKNESTLFDKQDDKVYCRVMCNVTLKSLSENTG